MRSLFSILVVVFCWSITHAGNAPNHAPIPHLWGNMIRLYPPLYEEGIDFDGVDEQGKVAVIDRLGEYVVKTDHKLLPLPLFIEFHARSTGAFPLPGPGWCVPLLESAVVPNGENRYEAWMPDGRHLPFAYLLAAFCLGTPSRYVQGMASRDASIENRLKIWETVPAMMRDAPGGWGSGRSGEAYTLRHQREEDSTRYRTLVGTHQTWLAEWGIWGRLLYLSGWIMAFIICVSARNSRAGPVPPGYLGFLGYRLYLQFRRGRIGAVDHSRFLPSRRLVRPPPRCVPEDHLAQHDLAPALLLAAAWPREAEKEIFRNNHAVIIGKGERTDISGS